MSEINGIPKALWDDVQFMLQETLDEYVPDFITQAVALYVIRAKEEAVSKAIANRTIAHRDAASNDTGFEHGRNHP